jgi:hypothetical protein
MLVRYQAEDKPTTVQATTTRGVSALLTGSKSALVPENTERITRRRRRLRTLEQVPPDEVAISGCSSTECTEELVPLHTGQS